MPFLIRFVVQEGFEIKTLNVGFQTQMTVIYPSYRLDTLDAQRQFPRLRDPGNPVKHLQRFLTPPPWSPLKDGACRVSVRDGACSDRASRSARPHVVFQNLPPSLRFPF